MSSANKHLIVWYLAILAAFGMPSAQANRPATPLKEQVLIDRILPEYWHCSAPLTGQKMTTLSCLVADNGFLYEPKISSFSGNDQFDAECFEALCDLSPLATSNKTHSGFTLQPVGASFGNWPRCLKAKHDAPEITEYLKTHPAQNTVVLHKIPFSVVSRYSDLISVKEFSAQANLVDVPVDVVESPVDEHGQRERGQPRYVNAIRQINEYWKRHLLDDGPVTRAKIDEFLNQIGPNLLGY